MLEAEAAWLAGFVDGEGSIVTYAAGRNKTSTAFVFSVPNTHRGSLEYCQRITGVGTIFDKPVTGNRKPQFVWQVKAQRDVISILQQIESYLIIKGDLARATIAGWTDLE